MPLRRCEVHLRRTAGRQNGRGDSLPLRSMPKGQGYAAAVAPILVSELTIECGEGQIRAFESSPGKIRAFCGTCGSPLWSKLAAKPDQVRLRLGVLDDPPDDLRIEAHTHTGGEPAWSRDDTRSQN